MRLGSRHDAGVRRQQRCQRGLGARTARARTRGLGRRIRTPAVEDPPGGQPCVMLPTSPPTPTSLEPRSRANPSRRSQRSSRDEGDTPSTLGAPSPPNARTAERNTSRSTSATGPSRSPGTCEPDDERPTDEPEPPESSTEHELRVSFFKLWEDVSWHVEALCRVEGIPTSTFVGRRGEHGRVAEARERGAVAEHCSRCPVRQECTDYGRRNGEYGVWGETSAQRHRAGVKIRHTTERRLK